MKELRDIIDAYDKATAQNKKTALATVVKVVGSSYRRPGARMLVTDDGEITGAISGGCLEGDALRKAQLALYSGKNRLVVYDTTGEDDATLGVQLGCNGIVYILFEPINSNDENNPVALLKKISLVRKASVLMTVFNENKQEEQKGTCCLLNSQEKQFASGECSRWERQGEAVLAAKASDVKTYDDCSVLFQFVPPPVHLIIAGAGNDVQPLTEMASIIGWQTTVIDGRATHATVRRFPKATTVIVAKPEKAASYIQADENTALLLMTHNYNYDLALLSKFLRQRFAYVGVLGPRQKLERMLAEIADAAHQVHHEPVQKIHGPVGLDIGAETAEEIAVSIVAEIKAVLSGRNGAPLKNKGPHIHDNHVLLPHE